MPGVAEVAPRTSAVSLLLDDLIDRSKFDVWVAVGTADEMPVTLGTTHHASDFGFGPGSDETVPAWAWQLSATVAREGVPVVLLHLDEIPDARRRSAVGVHSGAQGVVGIPILTPDRRPLGVLCGLSRTFRGDALRAVIPHAEVIARVIGTVLAHEAEIARLAFRLDNLEGVQPILRSSGTDERTVDALLEKARVQLSLDQVVVGRFQDGLHVIVNAAVGPGEPSMAGFAEVDDGSLARLVVDGLVPGAIQDVTAIPALASVKGIHDLQIRTHVGVPLRRPDGVLFGSLCAFAHVVKPGAGDDDLAALGVVARQIGAFLVDRDRSEDEARLFVREFDAVMAGGGPQIVYQPVVALAELTPAGSEALSRFRGSARPPDQWFVRATQAGRGPELELLAIRRALLGLRFAEGFLSLNVSPSTVLLPEFVQIMKGEPLDRLVLEVTEHTQICDYGPLAEVLRPLRALGLRIAVDDVGAGFASMRHILMLAPEIIKLDLSLVHRISSDPRRRSLAAALLTFATDLGAVVIAEGVETASELDCLRELGVQYGQGFHLGRPGPMRMV
jgi:EAL domain-containing protein (putative c-di-GMP-specific phosphodiesterase class I)